jgi:Spy/CpxP family protein refolding chaperone
VNEALKWKLICGFLLVFIAGCLTGAFVAAATTRHYLFAAGHHGITADRMRERLKAELNLTPEQTAKISPILDKAAVQLQAIRKDTGQRVHEVFATTHNQIAADLTPEQRTKLEQMRERHHRMMQRHHRHGPAPPPGAPPPPAPNDDEE